MVITWHGDTCFTIKNKKTNLVIDPYKDIKEAPNKADVVLVGNENRELVKFPEETIIFNWPGEYETRGIPIIALKAWDKSLSDEKDKNKGNQVNVFKFEVEGINICHLTNIGHSIKSDMVEDLGDIDVLFIPAGDSGNLPAKKAHEILEQIDPRAIILMGKGSFAEFLKESGAQIEEREKFEVTVKSQFQEDRTEYVLLQKS
ncbi:MAG: MBL fold metallo-hydrolase [Patescibacteria group bacterium]|nr:MBL fold metallo-hydrolase [Patescibacteria group bacterium]